MAQRGELRIVVRDGDRHALLMDARVKGGEIYSGSKLVWGGGLFRRSPHIQAKRERQLFDDSGGDSARKLRLSAAGSDLDLLEWNYRPPADRGKRVTRIVELPKVAGCPGFTSELWAFAPGCPELIDRHLAEHYEPGGRVLAYAVTDWTSPSILALLWTLKTPAWEGIPEAASQGQG